MEAKVGNKFFKVALVLATVALFCPRSARAAGCTTAQHDGHEYRFCDDDKSWNDAKTACGALGMTLVRIDNATENAFIRSRLSGTAWIGANDKVDEGDWDWIDGVQFWSDGVFGFGAGPVNGLYANWASHEPNDYLAQDCGAIESVFGKWLDESCHWSKDYVCEKELVDHCPRDPNKYEPGVCGCGVPDSDGDADGTADCIDQCPADPKHTEPGDCGCLGEANLRPKGAVCFDGPCGAANQCDGAGSCGSAADCSAEPDCRVEQFESHAYLFCKKDRTWEHARAKCRSVPGMDLVRIDSAAEDAFVAENIAHSAWIGGNDQATEGAWRWTDNGSQFWSGAANGSPVGSGYTNWQSGEPDNSSWFHPYEQDCALHTGTEQHTKHSCGYKDGGGWTSKKCLATEHYVCEEMDTCAAKTCADLGAQCGAIMDGCGKITDCGGCGPGLICEKHLCGKPGPQVPNTLSCQYPLAWGGFGENCPADQFPDTRHDGEGFFCPVDPAHADPTTLLNTNQQLTTTFTTNGAGQDIAGPVQQTPGAASAAGGCVYEECTDANVHLGRTGADPAVVAAINAAPPAGSRCAPVAQPDFCPVDPETLVLPGGVTPGNASLATDSCDPDNDTCPGDTECTLVCTELACKDESDYAYHCGLRYSTCNITEIPNDGALCSEIRECTQDNVFGTIVPVNPPVEAPPKLAGDPNFCCSDGLFSHPDCGTAQVAAVCATKPYVFGDDIDNAATGQRCPLDVEGGIVDAVQTTYADQTQQADKKWGMTYLPVLINNVALDGRPFGQDFLSLDEGAEWIVEAKVFGQAIEIMNLSARATLSPCEVSGTTTARVFGQDVDVFSEDTTGGEDFPRETPSAAVAQCRALYEVTKAAEELASSFDFVNDGIRPVLDVPDISSGPATSGIVAAGNRLKKAFFDAREITRALVEPGSTANEWASGLSVSRGLCSKTVERFYLTTNPNEVDANFRQVIDAVRGPLEPSEYCGIGAFDPAVAREIADAWIRRYERAANDYLRMLTQQMRMLASIRAKEIIQIQGPEDQQFLDTSAKFRFPIGPLNLLVEVGASGSWGVDGQLSFELDTSEAPPEPPAAGDVADPRATLDNACQPGDTDCKSGQPHLSATFSILPHVTATGRAFLGLEIGNDLLGADVGIEGKLDLIDVRLPANAFIKLERHAEPDPRPIGLDFSPQALFSDQPNPPALQCNLAAPNPNAACTARDGGVCTQVDLDPAAPGRCIYEDDRRAGFYFKPVLYNWDLKYGSDAKLVVSTMNGQIDVRARVKFLLASKTFRKKLADWTGYNRTFNLLGQEVNGKLTAIERFPDLGAFEMEIQFPRIPRLRTLPAGITDYTSIPRFDDDPTNVRLSRLGPACFTVD